MVRRAEMQHVELVDDGASDGADDRVRTPPPDGPGSGEPPSGADRPPARRRRRVLALAGVAVVTAAGLVVAQLVVDARDRAHRAAWGALPGVVAPLGDELAVAWTLEHGLGYGALAFPSRDDALVAVPVAEDGSIDAVSLDLMTGAEAWRTPLLPADDERSRAGERLTSGPPCATTDEGSGLVACLLSDGFEYADADGAIVRMPSTWTRLVVLDGTTGKKVLDREVPPADAVDVSGATVVSGAIEGGQVVVRGLAARTGDEVWMHEHDPAGELAEDRSYDMRIGPTVSVVAGGGVVGVTDPDGTVTVLGLPDGAVRETSAPTGWYGMEKVPDLDGVVVVTRRGGADVSVLMRDGLPDLELPGLVLPVAVDDGSVPDFVLTLTTGGLTAWDLSTGTERWISKRNANGGGILLGGVLYIGTGDKALVAFDATDGSERWLVPAEPDRYSDTPFTDGARLYYTSESTPEGGNARETHVFAYSFEGEPLGEVATPDGIDGAHPFGRALVGWSEQRDTISILR